MDAAVLPGQRNLPQLVGVVPLGQQVEEAGLAGVCKSLAMFNKYNYFTRHTELFEKWDLLLKLW